MKKPPTKPPATLLTFPRRPTATPSSEAIPACDADVCGREEVSPGRYACATCGQRVRRLYQVSGNSLDARPYLTDSFPACSLNRKEETKNG